MDRFDLAEDEIPLIFYRVQYRESMTTYDSDGGLEARDIDTLYNEEEDLEFSDAVEGHLNWDRHMSMFFSLFSDRRHAENWMLERHSRFCSRNCTLLEIDMAALRDSYVLRAEEIVDVFSLSIKNGAQASITQEYLVVHYIPPFAIIRSQIVHEIEKLFLTRNRSFSVPLTASVYLPDCRHLPSHLENRLRVCEIWQRDSLLPSSYTSFMISQLSQPFLEPPVV